MVSVTQVLDAVVEPELVAWYRRKGFRACDQISEDAKRIGTMVDALVQAEVKGETIPELPLDEEIVLSCWTAWQRFLTEHPSFRGSVTGIQTEVTQGELVGHPDFIVTEPGRWGIVDLKTSRAVHPKHWVQVAAYLMLKLKEDIMRDCFLGLLRLDKDSGHYEYREITDPMEIAHQIHVFQAYYTIYQHRQAHRELMRQMAEQEVMDVA